VLATGSAFALFGVLGLVLAALFTLLALLPGDSEARELRCQRIVHHTFRFFIRYMQALGILRFHIEGAEALRMPGQVVVANHPTLLDVVFLVSQMPQADCVVKAEAWSNPFMRGVVTAAGYVPNDEGEALVDACADRVARGRTLVLFPEGTRSPLRGLGRFRRGAAHIALRAGRPLRPVTIRCEPPSLMRGQRWYAVPPRRMNFTLECADVLDPTLLASGEQRRSVAARVVTAALREFFGKRVLEREATVQHGRPGETS